MLMTMSWSGTGAKTTEGESDPRIWVPVLKGRRYVYDMLSLDNSSWECTVLLRWTLSGKNETAVNGMNTEWFGWQLFISSGHQPFALTVGLL